jgi:ornithine decarboxylase
VKPKHIQRLTRAGNQILQQLGWTFLYLFSAFSENIDTQNSYLEIAIRAAQDHLSKDACKTVHDKFQFLNELSNHPSCVDTFHVVDVGVLANRLSLWQQYLPDVVPHYAVKTNSDLVITQVLAALGTGFDCASEKEIAQILAQGVHPSKIVFAHPRKPNSSILYAKKNGVNLFTFDSIEELDKILNIYPEANLLLRIKTDDSHSIIKLSNKFGATLEESYEILATGFSRNARIVGIAFHVGSNCTHLESYRKAILDAAELFRYSKNYWDKGFSLLDLGGGWPGTNDESFVEIAQAVNELIHTHFSLQTRFIAEPGRYFAAKTTTLAMKVIGKKRLNQEAKIAYYLSNGVYGFFMSSLYYEYNSEKILTEGWKIKPLVANSNSLYPSLLWGPTCDSGDKILDEIFLPEVETGDFLTVENLGAYSKSLETFFNGIAPSKAYYICECFVEGKAP